MHHRRTLVNFKLAWRATALTVGLVGASYLALTYPWLWQCVKVGFLVALLWVAFYGLLYAIEQEGKQTEWSGER